MRNHANEEVNGEFSAATVRSGKRNRTRNSESVSSSSSSRKVQNGSERWKSKINSSRKRGKSENSEAEEQTSSLKRQRSDIQPSGKERANEVSMSRSAPNSGRRAKKSRRNKTLEKQKSSSSVKVDTENHRTSARTANRPKVHFKDLDDPWKLIQEQRKFMVPEKQGKQKLKPVSETQKRDSNVSKARKGSIEEAAVQNNSSVNFPLELEEKRKRMQTLLRRVRWNQSFIDAWQNTGFRNRQQGRVIDATSMKKCQESISTLKREILHVLRQIEKYNDNLPKVGDMPKTKENKTETDDDGIHYSSFQCCVCGSAEDEEDENDILMCDGEDCNRCFHQKCCIPPVLEEEKGDDDSDWFCRRCLCLGDALRAINETFDLDVDNSAELEGQWTTSSSSASNSAVSEVSSAAAEPTDSEPSSRDRSSSVDTQSVVDTGKGRRLRNKGPVDYLSLNFIYFGQSADELEGMAEGNEDKKQLASLFQNNASGVSEGADDSSSVDNEYVPPEGFDESATSDTSDDDDDDDDEQDGQSNSEQENSAASSKPVVNNGNLLAAVENGEWDESDEESFAPDEENEDASETGSSDDDE